MKRGTLIAFEGLDGSGKSTQLELLAGTLRGAGHEVVTTREPTDGPMGQRIRAMARTGDPHSATAQFFINVKDNTFLNHTSQTTRGWGYTVFGKVTAGMDVVDAIKTVKTGARGPFPRDVPLEDVVITSAKVITDRETGRPRGFAFVEFSTPDEANAAVEMFHEKEFQGRALTVNVARPREERAPSAGSYGDMR